MGDEYESFLKEQHQPVTDAVATSGQQQEQALQMPRARGTAVDVSDLEKLGKWVNEAAQEFGGIDYVIANGMLDSSFCTPYDSFCFSVCFFKTFWLSSSPPLEKCFLIPLDYPPSTAYHLSTHYLASFLLASPLILSHTLPDWEISFRADILGLVHLLSTATPHLALSTRHPSICVVSSGAGNEIHAPLGPYGPIKLAQIHHAKALSHSLAPQGVRVNSVSPRNILTSGGNVENLMKQEERDGVKGAWETVRKGIPLGRAGSVEEVAGVVMFLCSPAAGYVTGANVRVDGGLSRSM